MKYHSMKTLLFLLFSVSVSAQLTSVNRIIFKAAKTDTVSVTFTPIGDAKLTVKSANSYVDNNLPINGMRVHYFELDSGQTIIASAVGTVGYLITRNGVQVNFTPVADNSLSNLKTILQSSVGVSLQSLTAAQVRALLGFFLYREGIIDENLVVKKVNTWAK